MLNKHDRAFFVYGRRKISRPSIFAIWSKGLHLRSYRRTSKEEIEEGYYPPEGRTRDAFDFRGKHYILWRSSRGRKIGWTFNEWI